MLLTTIGWVDILDRTQIAGWAFDDRSGAAAIKVQITVDGQNTTITANAARPDLQAGLGSANHGFVFAMPTLTPGAHTVAVAAIDPVDAHLVALKQATLTNPAPKGAVETHTDTTLVGWAFDADAGASAAQVRVDVNGAILTSVAADLPRPDLQATLGSANHGFSVTGAFAGKVVEVSALDTPSGAPALLWSNDHTPIGSVDLFTNAQAIGWAWDQDSGAAALQVRVLIDGVTATTVTASLSRPDLQAGLGSSNHGYSIDLQPLLGPGTHQVQIVAVDPQSLINPTKLLGEKTFTNAAPIGAMDVATPNQVIGWVLDPTNGATSINYQIKVDDVPATSGTAAAPRADLGVMRLGTMHGFTATLTGVSDEPHWVTLFGVDVPSGQATLVATKAVGNHLPFGWVDGADLNNIVGWAYDSDPNGPASVRLYIDGVAYETVVADQARADLAFLGSTNHAFTIPTPTIGFGPHTIQMYAVDTFTQETVLIGTKTVTNRAPIGWIDIATPTQVLGWAFDLEANSTPIDVLLSVDGVVVARTTANLSRPDLQAGLGSSNHGFSFVFSGLTPGRHSYQVFAVDPEGVTASLGVRTITV